ncbi:S26 family signal peptidase [Mobiluncus curtisii]|uniref:S26 family signal peptidase n=2 Tax=Mobiluncus curtisii TaxID=2051 RepID=A0A7Y0YBR4_9ACTO|nr:S26 family signal peptidase [Mobiluncus curtisii]EFL93125.1 hypothetical protein HMPREF0574_1726 [Mobiluncus curtisii subsp. curtisii ATCC 35241]STY76609.1 signal peptidase I [Mobiluncus curtisii subsp. curtisii]MCU9986871.1 S26 family signal peptidase [Mobiluncus curtisii]MCU9999771.1 S26 family signal peptidase [Mobiluncus curtisii]MCV0019891.1 S26 family signal peptidase [Mobiluncus curtisii]
MTMQSNRIVSLLNKQSQHPLRNAIIFMIGWVILILVGVVFIVTTVIPRTQGYVATVVPDDSMSPTLSRSDLLLFQKIRQEGAQKLNPNDIIAYQPTEAVKYKIARISEVMGTGKDMQFGVKFDNPQAESSDGTVTLDMVRGTLRYKVPFCGTVTPLLPPPAVSYMLIFVAQLLLIYAGWQIGTSMINARDPQRQARAARLRTAALAGNLETTRQRLRRQGLK